MSISPSRRTGTRAAEARRILRLIGPHARSYRGWFLLAYLLLLAANFTNLLKPWPLKLIIDQIVLGRPLPGPLLFLDDLVGHDKLVLLAALSLGIVAIVFLEGLFAFGHKYFIGGAGEGTINAVRQQLFAHLQDLGHDSGRTGDLVVRLTSDIHSLKLLITRYLQTAVSSVVTFFGIAAAMFLLDVQLTLLALAVVPALFLLSFLFTARVEELVRRRRAKESEMATLVHETVASKDIVQAFAREEHEKRRFARESAESLAATLESMRMSKGYGRTVQVIVAAGTALVVYFGARRALAGQVTIGDLVVFVAYLRDFYRPVEGLSELILDLAGALVCGGRLADIVDTPVAVSDAPDAIPAPAFRGEVRFERVTFGYEPGNPVLQDLTLTVLPGQTVALIGSSGTGKSTVVNLLLRFHDPWSGRVLIDGEDIRRFTLRSLRERISAVLQDPLLFGRTIRENIAYGRPEAGLEEIRAAAGAAQADDFITSLPDGYETSLEERGGNLSGGQRQRIALARAILKDAPILVFDEPATGVDAATEARLGETLDRLARGKTRFIVAHRFSTIVKADLIVMIEEGRVVEQGTHAQLLARSERYRRLYELQRLEPPAAGSPGREGA